MEYLPEMIYSDDVAVILHDGLGSVEKFKDFPQNFANALGIKTIAYDRRGYGKSSAYDFNNNKYYMHDEALQILPEILKKLQIENPVLFGHSDGGSIAMIYAGEFGACKLIALAPHIYVEDKTGDAVKKEVDIFNAGILKRALRKYHGANIEGVFSGWSGNWLSDEFKSWNITDYIKKIDCPALIMQGSEDEYATKEQFEAMSKNIKNAQRELLEGMNHMPLESHGGEILEIIQDFYLNEKKESENHVERESIK
jgi:pimeloyl-ACP methyl ester carboxylesterase